MKEEVELKPIGYLIVLFFTLFTVNIFYPNTVWINISLIILLILIVLNGVSWAIKQ